MPVAPYGHLDSNRPLASFDLYTPRASDTQFAMDYLKENIAQADAVQQLQQGCARLGLHGDVALELVGFLYLRRHFAPEIGGEEPQGLYPGSRLVQLWHWMLLNTQVACAVHKLIGGEVEHASSDEEDLSEDTQVVRRLAALNLLATQGWSPTLGFWEEPGTSPLHSLRRISYGAQQVPLYVPGGASMPLCNTLARLVWGANAILALSGPTEPTAAARHPTTAVAAAHHIIDGPQPPYRFTLVFHMRPTLQYTPPRLQASTIVTVSCKPDATVSDLYLGAARYLSPSQDPTQAQLKAAAGQLWLLHGDTHYVDMGSSLKEAGLQQGHVVHVWDQGQYHLAPGVVSRQELPPGFHITVKTLTGNNHVLLVHREMLVLELKQLVGDCAGVPPCQQRLIMERGVTLDDMCTLKEYRIHQGDVITMMMRLRGC